jgi:hypothetical protein
MAAGLVPLRGSAESTGLLTARIEFALQPGQNSEVKSF